MIFLYLTTALGISKILYKIKFYLSVKNENFTLWPLSPNSIYISYLTHRDKILFYIGFLKF